MFLRRNRRVIDGEIYEYWTLVKTVRTARGPRQEIVAALGKEPGLESRSRHGWEEGGRSAGRPDSRLAARGTGPVVSAVPAAAVGESGSGGRARGAGARFWASGLCVLCG
jgi:hypothetical protein